MEDNLTTLAGGAPAAPPMYPPSGMQTAITQKPFDDRAEKTPFMDVVSVKMGLDDTGINVYESLRLGGFKPEEGYEVPEDWMDQMEKRGIAAHHMEDLLDSTSTEEFTARMNLYEQRGIDERWADSMGGKGDWAGLLGQMADLPGLALDGAATAVGGAGLVSRTGRMAAAAGAFGAGGVVRGYMGSRVDNDYTAGQAMVDLAANAVFGAAFQGGMDWLHPAERIALQNKMLANADPTNPATIARKAREAADAAKDSGDVAFTEYPQGWRPQTDSQRAKAFSERPIEATGIKTDSERALEIVNRPLDDGQLARVPKTPSQIAKWLTEQPIDTGNVPAKIEASFAAEQGVNLLRQAELERRGATALEVGPADLNLLPESPSAAIPGATPEANARAIAIQQEQRMRGRLNPQEARDTVWAELGRLRTNGSAIKTADELEALQEEQVLLRDMASEQKRVLETGKGDLFDEDLAKLVDERTELITLLATKGTPEVPLSDIQAAVHRARLTELKGEINSRAKAVNDELAAAQKDIADKMEAHNASEPWGFKYRALMGQYMDAVRSGETSLLELAESMIPRKPVIRPGVDLDGLPGAVSKAAPGAPVRTAEELAAAKAADDAADAADAAEEAADAAQSIADASADAALGRELADKAAGNLAAVDKAASATMKSKINEAVAKSRKVVEDIVAKAKSTMETATGVKVAAVVAKMTKKMDKALEELKTAAAVISDPKIKAINVELEKAIKAATAESKTALQAAYKKAATEAADVAAAAKVKVAEATKKAIADGKEKDVANAAKAAAIAKIDAVHAAAKAAAKKSQGASLSTEAAAAIEAFKDAAKEKIAAVHIATSKAVSARKSKIRDDINEESSIALGKVKAADAAKNLKELQKIKAAAKTDANTELVKAIKAAELGAAEHVQASGNRAVAKIAAAVDEVRGARNKVRAAEKAARPPKPARSTPEEAVETVADPTTTVADPTTPVPDDSAGAQRVDKFTVDDIDYDQSLTVGGDVAKGLEELAQREADILSKTPAFGGIGYISGIVRGSKNAIVRLLGRLYFGDSVMAVRGGKEIVNEAAISDLAGINFQTIFGGYRRATEPNIAGFYTGWKGAAKRIMSANSRQEFQAKVTRAVRGHFEEHPSILKAAAVASKAFNDSLELMQKYGVEGADKVIKAADYVPRMPKQDFIESMTALMKSTFQGSSDANAAVEALLAKSIDLAAIRAGRTPDANVTKQIAKAMSDRLFYKTKTPNIYEAPQFDLDHLDDILRNQNVSLEDREIIGRFFNGRDPSKKDIVASDHFKHRVMLDETASIQLDDGSIISISDLFEDDMERIVGEYTRHSAGLAAFAEKGHPNPRKLWAIIEDMRTKGLLTDDEYKSLDLGHRAFLGMPLQNDPAGRAVKALRTVGNLNFASMLQSVSWAQIGEIGGVLAEGGWKAMFQQMPALPEVLKAAYTGQIDSVMAREMASLGEPGASGILNPISMRAQDYDLVGKAGAIEQGSRVIARTSSWVSGMVPMTDALQQMTSRILMQRLFNISKTTDPVSNAFMSRLKHAGLDVEDVTEIRAHLAAHGKEENGRLIENNLQAMNPDLQRKLQVMMHRQTRRLIQTQDIGDTMPWVHGPAAKAALQFRVFSIAALPKKTLHAAYRHDSISAQTFLFGLGAASIGLAGRTITSHPSDSKHYQDVFSSPGRFLALSWAASGESSVMPMLWDTVAWLTDHNYKIGNASRSSGNASDIVTGNPYVAMGNDVGTVLKMAPKLIMGGQVTKEDVRALSGVAMLRTMLGVSYGLRELAEKYPSKWEVERDANR